MFSISSSKFLPNYSDSFSGGGLRGQRFNPISLVSTFPSFHPLHHHSSEKTTTMNFFILCQQNVKHDISCRRRNVIMKRRIKTTFSFSSTSMELWPRPGSWSSRKWIGVWTRFDFWPPSESFPAPTSPRSRNNWEESKNSMKNFYLFSLKMDWWLLRRENCWAVRTLSTT